MAGLLVTSAWLLSVGAATEVTVTVKLLVPVLLAASVAIHVTVVIPELNDAPEAGVQTTLTGVAQPVPAGAL